MLLATSPSVAHVLKTRPTGPRSRGVKHATGVSDLERPRAGNRLISLHLDLLAATRMRPTASTAPKLATMRATRPSDPEAPHPPARAPRNPQKPAYKPMPHHSAPPPTYQQPCLPARSPPPCAPPPPPEHARLPHARGRTWPPHHRLPHLPNHRLRTRRRLPRRMHIPPCPPCLLACSPNSPPSPPAWPPSTPTCACSSVRTAPCCSARRCTTPCTRSGRAPPRNRCPRPHCRLACLPTVQPHRCCKAAARAATACA